jgi:hypothetical protein
VINRTPVDDCPGCGADLRRGPAPDGGFYTDTIGVQVRGVYDGVLFWQCPRCDHRWHCFPPGSPYRARAEPYVGTP